ncbi:ABC transporter ATP-binding protein [Sporosarcina sp. Te-1]|uniref:ABC transporter ATP-binding protein n=1 Tax=Sporosarcina sp. Te-1 TaxID=2818390 RepID=UPI001A9FD46C|nr:ABC transporter ATP-binding protein [Sporosarcina sp. Te-1]QTD43152.1 ABC transporter ATP-binding protein [Sporosarcina sp. Te-1]
MIRFENASKTYDDQTLVVDSINLEIDRGEFLVLIGPSGCGKTTTLKMINRLIPLSDGTIWIDGKKVSEYPIHELRWRIGYVLQQIALFPHMTIEENIAIVPELKKWKKEQIHARVTGLLTMVGLDPDTYRQRKPSELSGGQQQRVGVVRALAADPDIILMDEPFSALDPISRAKLQEDLLHLQKTIQKTIVFVTHDIQEALKLGDRICIMNDGKIEQLDTPEEILAHPATSFVREFMYSGKSDPFVLSDHVTPLTEEAHELPILSSKAELSEVLNTLAHSEQAAVEEEGKVIGMISRVTVIAYLAERTGIA